MKFCRITENGLFRKAYKSGKRKGSRSLTVFVLKDRAAEHLRRSHPERIIVNRLGISASKKVGGAVQRNRAKRVIRAAYREASTDIRRGHLIVISARGAIIGKKSTEVARELKKAFAELGMTVADKPQNEEK